MVQYRMKGTKNMGMNKKMSMNKAQTKAAVPKKGSAAMKKKMAALRGKKGKK